MQRSRLGGLLGMLLLTPLGVVPASAAGDRITYVPAARSLVYDTGSDGNVWVPDSEADVVRRLTPSGPAAPVALADVGNVLTAAFDGTIWAVASGGEVRRINPAAPTSALVHDFGATNVEALVAAGPDLIWARLSSSTPGERDLALLGPAGLVDTFTVSATYPNNGFHPAGGAPDGSLWFGTSAAPGDQQNTKLTRVAVDGGVTSVQLVTGNAHGGLPEDVTSLAFAADGTLWFTTYSEEAVTVSGAHGGGIGRYADGVTTWWPRPLFPESVPDATYSSGPLPHDLQRGPDGRFYFEERSADGLRLSRFTTDPRVVQYFEVGDYYGPSLGAGRVWWGSSGRPGFGVADLDALFAKRKVDRTVGLRFKTATKAFTGRVRASDDDCRRAVLGLYRTRPGPDAKVRSGRSKADGRFVLRLRPDERRSGRYYVKAARSGHPDGISRCGSDKSRIRAVRLR